jgi:hypothetical protein
MERELWLLLCRMALSCDQLTKARYRPAVIVGVYGWGHRPRSAGELGVPAAELAGGVVR